VQTKKPSLEAFDEKITMLTAIRDEIIEASARPTADIGWLRVNATPLIKELEKTTNEWIAAYTGFLLDNTTREIENIEKFIKTVCWRIILGRSRALPAAASPISASLFLTARLCSGTGLTIGVARLARFSPAL